MHRQDDDPACLRGYARTGMSARRLADRARSLDPHRVNLALAVALAVEIQVEVALLDLDAGLRASLHALLLLVPLAFALRLRHPVLAVLLAQVVFTVTQGAYPKDASDNLYAPLFVILFLTVSGAMHAEGRRFWLVVALASAGGTITTFTDEYGEGSDVEDLLFMAVVFTGLTTAVGRLLRNRASLQSALRDKTSRLERERADRAEQAALEERTRIAGDLHDIIAHALSGMVVQASAARRLTERDHDRAREAFGAVEDSGREALAELRRLLGVLRREDEELALAPTPSLAHVESLVRRARAAGLPVDLVVEGEPAVVPAGVDLTAYRVLQDALNEALEQGGAGRATVAVRFGADVVEVEVRDDGPAGGDRRRLLGMRERVLLVGGELTAGPPRDGGHAVRARLPLEAPA